MCPAESRVSAVDHREWFQTTSGTTNPKGNLPIDTVDCGSTLRNSHTLKGLRVQLPTAPFSCSSMAEQAAVNRSIQVRVLTGEPNTEHKLYAKSLINK